MPESANSPSPNASHLGSPVIGIAGGIGSGKSEVARLLAAMGCVVTHSDEDVRQVLLEQDVRDRLVEWWGPQVLDQAGRIDRRAVARIVFEDETQRRRLEGFVHPKVDARRKRKWAQAAATGPVTAFVIDAPLLFEAGLDRNCDAVIFVDAAEQTRLARVKEGRGWDAAELHRREKNQWPLETKRERSDYVIVNEGDVADLSRRVRLTLDEILTKSAGCEPRKGSRPAP
ncbi:MAG: dephospho-CoA kinase [Phycisphaerales bacterium]|nr:dephospho-CoA kinase [Phycisphaerales bacterium]